MDVETLERIKELGLKRKFIVVGMVETRIEHGPQTRAFINTYFDHCLNVIKQNGITLPLECIQSIKLYPYALHHHIDLNDTDICFITETWINTDHDLQLLTANISGLGYKIINKY